MRKKRAVNKEEMMDILAVGKVLPKGKREYYRPFRRFGTRRYLENHHRAERLHDWRRECVEKY
jgi:hypothetical protein